MKMEILAVQNEFMHVMPSKSKDGSTTLRWTSPTAPQSATALKKSQSNKILKQSRHEQEQKKLRLESAEMGMSAVDQLWDDEEEEDSFLTTLPHWNESEIEDVRNVLMTTLRDAKERHLGCTEVLLPCDMLERIAIDMLSASDEEACGIRGANIRIEYDNGSELNEIAACNTDHNTVATFELKLTIKQEHSRSKWISSIMPQFLRNLTRATTIVISPDYTLSKHKLNYSFAE